MRFIQSEYHIKYIAAELAVSLIHNQIIGIKKSVAAQLLASKSVDGEDCR